MDFEWQELHRRMPFEILETARGRRSYRRAGLDANAGPPLVFLHGIGSGSGSWCLQLAVFGNARPAVAWDAPGYGQSDPPAGEATADAYAEDVVAFLDALGYSRVVLVAQSLGAIMAARVARHWPDRLAALVLADPTSGHAPLDAEERAQKKRQRLAPFRSLDRETHARQRAPNQLGAAPSAAVLALVEDGLQRLRPEGYEAAASLLSVGDTAADLAEVRLPALVICGGADRLTPPAEVRRLAQHLPRPARYVEVPDAGHACYAEAPTSFNAALADFLDDIPPR